MNGVRIGLGMAAAAVGLAMSAGAAQAFCGFYVAQAGTDLFNEASKVIYVRDGDRSVITMANDYQGELTEFALVVPVPTVLREQDIDVVDPAVIDHLDAYTAPRLVEYHDFDPCEPLPLPTVGATSAPEMVDSAPSLGAAGLGVTIEAEYTVGEYDILILSAAESAGLQLWLSANGYQVPPQAEPVLADYISAGMKFFVARVNLKEQSALGYSYLRPLQISTVSPEFMLPIRLGMVNAKGPQELFVFMLNRTGQVVTVHTPTVQLPTGSNVPLYVADNFDDFYLAMFDQQVERNNMRSVFMEYAWDMAWCDPCAADPLSASELSQLGVWWADGGDGQAPDVFVTRLHLRYSAESFANDLVFRETGNRDNFQGRYVLNHPFRGPATCEAAESYFRSLPSRFETEAQSLAQLTGWSINEIRRQMEANGQPFDAHRAADDDDFWDDHQ